MTVGDATNTNLGEVLSQTLMEGLGVGIVVLDDDYRIGLWNGFMARHSGKEAAEVLGRSLFEVFPELPRGWLELKFRSVRALRNKSFVSWKQRPFLFRFLHNRPIKGGILEMRQDCTFLPLFEAGRVFTCIAVHDQTDAALIQYELDEASDANRVLEEMSTTDALTSALNRGHIERVLHDAFHDAIRRATPSSLIMFDLDQFKRVNDTYGHLAGDEVLRCVARAVQQQLRPEDALGRYGGEEFMVVLPKTGVNGAVGVAERLRAQIERLVIQHGDQTIPVTVSLGVAESRPDMKDHLELIHAADIALYRSKHGGRNRVTAFDHGPEPGGRAR